MKELNMEDMIRVLSSLPKDILDMMMGNPVYLAGGYIRAVVSGEKPHDIDLFGGGVEQLDCFARALFTMRSEKDRIHRTDNAITLITKGRMPVQFITRWTYKTPQDIIPDFDFSIAQAAIWYDRGHECWKSAIGDRFYEDLAAKRLTYLAPKRDEDAGGSMLRALKFVKKGFHIDTTNLGLVVARLMRGVNTQNEASSAFAATARLREVDPLRVIDGIYIGMP